MSTRSKDASTEAIYAAPIPDALAQHIAAARIVASSGGGSNPHAIVNAHNLAEKKKLIVKACYDETGRTIPAAVVLATDAERKIRHSRVLAKNINRASGGQARERNTDTHHIVASLDGRAHYSRAFLFAWGIGINDADNGVYLPRCRRTIIAAMPGACSHRHLHTDYYYVNVELQLRSALGHPTPVARAVLRGIKGELIAGTFTY